MLSQPDGKQRPLEVTAGLRFTESVAALLDFTNDPVLLA
jgi:hypothetical protein